MPRWSHEQTQALIRLWDRELSEQQIANRLNEMFGTRHTRNAVSGKAERLCLPPRGKPKTDLPED